MTNEMKNGQLIWNRRISMFLQRLEEETINAESFWQEFNLLGALEITGTKFERDVTFLWRASDSLQGVCLWLKRVMNKKV
ncbi:hypothetical protein [Enterobacter ludwigii]|uniref:hypothetical protein n=1 Tax=Enterobacter ludwigii TaxID=299767 RepID=UPI002FF56A81